MQIKWIHNILFFRQNNSLFLNKKKIWKRCPVCKNFIFVKKIKKNFNICYKCNFHFYITSKQRIKLILKKNFFELFNNLLPIDFLNFFDTKHYYSRLVESQIKTNQIEAISILKGKIIDINAIICIFEFRFIGGSLSRVVGNKLLNAANFCIKYKLPMVCFFSSGGARMQESVIALTQMAKISSILNNFKRKNIPYISILTNPCMGGVSASIAMMGDINIAEPKALIGFTGLKVIEKFFDKKNINEFQKSEFLLENGFIDFIVNRKKIRLKIYNILKMLVKKKEVL